MVYLGYGLSICSSKYQDANNTGHFLGSIIWGLGHIIHILKKKMIPTQNPYQHL